MSINQVKGVIVPRHDVAENWAKAVNFTPKKGELIVYDADTTIYKKTGISQGKSFEVEASGIVRFKFGDGETNVNLLPFVTTEGGGTGGVSIEQLESYISPVSEKLAALEENSAQQLNNLNKDLNDLNDKIVSVDKEFDETSENAQSGKAVKEAITKKIPVKFDSTNSYATILNNSPENGIYDVTYVASINNDTYTIELSFGQIYLNTSTMPTQLTGGAKIKIEFGNSKGNNTYQINKLEVIVDKFIDEDFVEYKANMEFDTIDLSLVDITSTTPSEAFEQFDGIYEILTVEPGVVHTSFGTTTPIFFYTFSTNSSSITVEAALEFPIGTKVRLKTKMTTNGVCELEEFTVIKDVRHKADLSYVDERLSNLDEAFAKAEEDISTLNQTIPETYVSKTSLPKISETEPENAQNGQIWIQPNSANGLIIDGIVEQGWAGDRGEWYYTKYRSGKIEAWYKSAVSWSVAATSVTSVNIVPPTGLFTDTPHFIHPQIRSTTTSPGYGELTIYADNTGTTSSNIRVSFGNRYDSLLKPAINMYVVQFGSNS